MLEWTPALAEADATALVVPTGPADRMETGALFFFAAIAAAQERVWIASPYCVPDTDILTALKHAALAGRDVRLLVPEVIDHHIPLACRLRLFRRAARGGRAESGATSEGSCTRRWFWSDDSLAAIGTTNLDNRSFRLNFEAMVLGFDDRFAAEVAQFLEADFAEATLVDKTPVGAAPARALRRAGGPGSSPRCSEPGVSCPALPRPAANRTGCRPRSHPARRRPR